MGEKYLIDTNAVSDYLRKNISENARLFMNGLVDNSPFISFVIQIELLSPKVPENELVEIFIEYCQIINISDDIIQKTIKIRRQKKIKLPDAIIAATAISLNLTLVTHNLSDFDRIPNLKILDLHTL